MADNRIGSLHYDIVADTQGFTKGTRVAQREIRELSKIAIDGMRPLDRLGLEFDVLAKLAKSSGAAMDTTAKKFARLGSESEEARAAAEKYTRSLKNQAAAIRASAQGRPLRDKEIAQIKQLEATHDAYQRELRQTKVRREELNIVEQRGTGLMASARSTMLGYASGLVGIGLAYRAARIAQDAFRESMEFEQRQMSFEVFLGSARDAEALMERLRNFSARTPLTIDTTTQSAKTLLQFGVAQDDIMQRLQQLGDISGGSTEAMQRLSLAFGQITANTRLQGQELRQLVEAGFNPLQVISEKTGESMSSLRVKMEEGAISVDMVAEALEEATGEGGRFNGMLDRIAEETAGGQIQILRGELQKLRLELTKTEAVGSGASFLTDIVKSVNFFNEAAGRDAAKGITDHIFASDGSFLSTLISQELGGATIGGAFADMLGGGGSKEIDAGLEEANQAAAARVAELKREVEIMREGAEAVELRRLREEGVSEELVKQLKTQMDAKREAEEEAERRRTSAQDLEAIGGKALQDAEVIQRRHNPFLQVREDLDRLEDLNAGFGLLSDEDAQAERERITQDFIDQQVSKITKSQAEAATTASQGSIAEFQLISQIDRTNSHAEEMAKRRHEVEVRVMQSIADGINRLPRDLEGFFAEAV